MRSGWIGLQMTQCLLGYGRGCVLRPYRRLLGLLFVVLANQQFLQLTNPYKRLPTPRIPPAFLFISHYLSSKNLLYLKSYRNFLRT
jgi:hypothetical protein